jgi:hypothetical protein
MNRDLTMTARTAEHSPVNTNPIASQDSPSEPRLKLRAIRPLDRIVCILLNI